MTGAPKLVRPQAIEVDLSQLATLKVESHLIGVGNDLPPEDLLKLATEVGFTNICQKQGYEYDRELKASHALVESPERFLEFPIASIFSPDRLNRAAEQQLTLLDEMFNSSVQKRHMLASLINALESKGLSQTMTEDITAVADELFTNAIYNAPFIDTATMRNPGISRQDMEIHYEAGKKGRLFLAADDSRLAIGVMDPFGTLDLKFYLNKIKATYLRGPAATMNFGPGGAGLGSYIIFNTGSSLYFGVWPRRATILCCVVPLGMSYRKRVQLPKHLHWIQR